jgi:hypothetical protein
MGALDSHAPAGESSLEMARAAAHALQLRSRRDRGADAHGRRPTPCKTPLLNPRTERISFLPRRGSERSLHSKIAPDIIIDR